jgi:metal-responsive CopG/Arc/MetJ family transcriptional regulator
MVKYGKYLKVSAMTKKITITLEENLIEELSIVAMDSGKKKAQIIREALQDYFDTQAVTKTVQEYKMGGLKTISHQDVRATLGL